MDLNNLSVLLEMDFYKIWDIFLMEVSSTGIEDDMEVLKLVKEGNLIKFDIEDWIKGRYVEKQFDIRKGGKIAGKKTIIIIGKHKYSKKDVEDEIAERRRGMIMWIKTNWSSTSMGSTREEEKENGE